MRWASLFVLMLTLCLGQTAFADGIDRRARQLRTSESYKVRLSAAVYLAKKKDGRAVDALVYALDNDSERNIRQIAAKGLSRQISARIPVDIRNRAYAVLSRVAKKDKDRKVRRRAKRALRKLAKLRRRDDRQKAVATASSKSPNAMFIHVGKTNIGKQKTPKGTDRAIQRVVSSKLRSLLPGRYFQMSKKLPTQAQLQRKNIHGWFVGANVNRLKVKRRGDTATVQCTVSMRVNRWFGRDAKQRLLANQTASAKGSASVDAANTRTAIASAKRDCLLAVAEQVTIDRVAPFLQRNRPVARRSSNEDTSVSTVSQRRIDSFSSKHGVRVSRSSN